MKHGFESSTKDGPQNLSLIAFFADGIVEPSCAGFHQYTPRTNLLMTWTRKQDGWDCEQTGHVVVDEEEVVLDIKPIKAPCPERSSP